MSVGGWWFVVGDVGVESHFSVQLWDKPKSTQSQPNNIKLSFRLSILQSKSFRRSSGILQVVLLSFLRFCPCIEM